MKITFCRWIAAATLASASAVCMAAPPPEAARNPAPPQVESPASPSPGAIFAGARVADEVALNGATAREDLSLVAQSQQANTVSRNSVNGVTTTGEIRIADNAFQNANGLTVINANTGNNVAMNASLNVNIVMTGPQ